MKALNVIFLFIFGVYFFSMGGLQAANKVFSIGKEYGIVADNDEWICHVNEKADPQLGVKQNEKSVYGESKYLPITFDFFPYCFSTKDISGYSEHDSMLCAQKYLSSYAMLTSTVFSNVTHIIRSDPFSVTGAFFDNNSYGSFALYYKSGGKKGTSYLMLIKIRGDLLNESCLNQLFLQIFSLITPLYSPIKN